MNIEQKITPPPGSNPDDVFSAANMVRPGFWAELNRAGFEGMQNVGHCWRELGLKAGDHLLLSERGQFAAVTIMPESEEKNFLLIVKINALMKRSADGAWSVTDKGPLEEFLGKNLGVMGPQCFIVPGFGPENRAATGQPPSEFSAATPSAAPS